MIESQGIEPTHNPPAARPAPAAVLSRREREVLDLASSGLTNNQIALRMRLTIHAVKFHLASTYRKLGVANRTEAAFVYRGSAHAVDRSSDVAAP